MSETRIKPRWMPYVLGVSLALNLMVIAAVASAVWVRGGPQDRVRGGGFATPYVMALETEDRRALRHAAIRAPRDQSARRAEYAAVLGALRAEPFDQASVAKVLTTQQTRVLDRQNMLRAAWLDRIAAMDAAQRAAYANRLEDIIARPRGTWRR